MGAWDIGPFDNDVAADFGGALDAAEPAVRVELVRTALMIAAENGAYLDSDEGCEAVAAAALVAEQLPGGAPENRHYWPKEPMPALTGLRRLAARAVDRVAANDSELSDLWTEGDGTPWLADMIRLRTILSAPDEAATSGSALPGQPAPVA